MNNDEVKAAAISFIKDVTSDRSVQQNTGDALFQAVKYALKPSWLTPSAVKHHHTDRADALNQLTRLESEVLAVKPDTFLPQAEVPAVPAASLPPVISISPPPSDPATVLVDGVPVAVVAQPPPAILPPATSPTPLVVEIPPLAPPSAAADASSNSPLPQPIDVQLPTEGMPAATPTQQPPVGQPPAH